MLIAAAAMWCGVVFIFGRWQGERSMKSRRAKDARGKLLPGGISLRELQREGLHPVRWDLICPAAQRSMRLSWRHARREAGCRPRRWGVGLDVLSLLLARNAVVNLPQNRGDMRYEE